MLEPVLYFGLNVKAWLHVMCAAPSSTRRIWSARHEPWIYSQNPSFTTLYCLTQLTSMFATISTDMIINEDILRFMPLHLVRFLLGM
jgi:hypothetical protein